MRATDLTTDVSEQRVIDGEASITRIPALQMTLLDECWCYGVGGPAPRPVVGITGPVGRTGGAFKRRCRTRW